MEVLAFWCGKEFNKDHLVFWLGKEINYGSPGLLVELRVFMKKRRNFSKFLRNDDVATFLLTNDATFLSFLLTNDANFCFFINKRRDF